MNWNLVNPDFWATGATHLDRIPHELSVNSLVSTKSNCAQEETRAENTRNSGREGQGDYLVVRDLFTFPPRSVAAHSWEIRSE